MAKNIQSIISEYMGIAFAHEQLAEELLRTQVYGLLDTGRGVNRDLVFRLDPELRPIVEAIRARPGRVML